MIRISSAAHRREILTSQPLSDELDGLVNMLYARYAAIYFQLLRKRAQDDGVALEITPQRRTRWIHVDSPAEKEWVTHLIPFWDFVRTSLERDLPLAGADPADLPKASPSQLQYQDDKGFALTVRYADLSGCQFFPADALGGPMIRLYCKNGARFQVQLATPQAAHALWQQIATALRFPALDAPLR